MKRRFLSIVLSLAMVVGMLPVAVLAEETQVTSVTDLTLAIADEASGYPGVLYLDWAVNDDVTDFGQNNISLQYHETDDNILTIQNTGVVAGATDTLYSENSDYDPAPLTYWIDTGNSAAGISANAGTTQTVNKATVSYYYGDDGTSPSAEIDVNLTIKYVTAEDAGYSLDWEWGNESNTRYGFNFGTETIPMFALDDIGYDDNDGNYNYVYANTNTKIYDDPADPYFDAETAYYVVVYTAEQNAGAGTDTADDDAYTLTLTKYPLTVNFEDTGDDDDGSVVPDGLQYTNDGNAITITDYTGSDTVLNIPSTIDSYPVTAINSNAFQGNGTIVEVVVPDGVTSIGQWAFSDCYSLEKVTLPTSLTSIGGSATGAYGIFEYCYNLETIIMENSVDSAFCVDGGVLFTADKTTLVHYPSNAVETSYAIPDTVNAIANFAFCWADSLTSITIPDSVSSFGNFLFSSCSSLTSVYVPAGVSSLNANMFGSCYSLSAITVNTNNASYCDVDGVLYNKDKTEMILFPLGSTVTTVEIPAGLTTVATGALDKSSLTAFTVETGNTSFSAEDGVLFNADKTELIRYPVGKTGDSYTIPSTVTAISASAFEDTQITSVTLSDNLESIGDYAFFECGITSVNIPATVNSISTNRPFGSLNENIFVSYTVDATNECYSAVDGVLFNKDQTTLIHYPTGKTGTDYTTPSTVTTISSYAFELCLLENLIVSENVDTLENLFLNRAVNMKTVTFENSAVTFLSMGILPDGIVIYGYADTTAETYANANNISFSEITDSSGDDTPAVSDYSYTLDSNGNATITGYTGSETVVEIPSEIDGYPVTAIGEKVFQSNEDITSVTIPEGVTHIGQWLFSDCFGLTTINLPASLTTIGDDSDITKWGFAEGCGNLTTITLADENDSFKLVDGGLINFAGTELIRYPGKNDAASYTIPEGVEKIWNHAFYESHNLTSISFPTSLTTIGFRSFGSCSGLTELTLSSAVLSVGNYSFGFCSRLTSVTIENDTMTIGTYAFTNTSGSLVIYGNSGSTAQTFATENSLTFAEIPKTSQSITLAAIGDKTYGDSTFELSASDYSGDVSNITYTSSDETVISISGTTATVVGAGEATITVTIAGDETYNSASDSETITVAKATPDYTLPIGLTATYGETLSDVTLSTGFAFVDVATTSVGNAGENNFAVTYTPDNTDNYNVVTDLIVTVTVAKASAPALTDMAEDVYYAEAQSNVTVDLNQVVGLPADAGATSYSISATDNTNGIISASGLTDGVLSFSTYAKETSGQTATYTIAVTMANYEDATFDVVVSTVDKTVVTISGVTVSDKDYDGQPASYSGTAAGDNGYTGEFVYSWDSDSADVGTYTLTVSVPESDEDFMGSETYTVVISPKALTISVNNASVYRNYALPTSISLTYSGLVTGDSFDVVPTFTLTYMSTDDEGNEIEVALTDSSTNGSYIITWKNTSDFVDSNYEITTTNTATLTISTKPSTSTSTPSTSDDDTTSDATTDSTTDTDSNVTVETETTTTTNDDGSVTTDTVETATDTTTGEVVATTKTETSVENDDGSVTTEIVATSKNETTGETTVTTATATTKTTDDGATVTETVATTTNETTGAVTESTSTETVTETGSVKEEVKTTTSAEGTVTEEKSTVIADTETKTEITATVVAENGETTAAQITAVATEGTSDVTIPQDVLTTVASETAAVIAVETSVAAIVLDETATNTVADAVSSAEDTQVVISAVVVEHEIVDQTITADLNNIVVVDLTISVGGENVSSFNGGSAKISIPYTPANESAPITLYYVADDGSVTLMDCTYDAETGAIVFETGHFSYYMVSENTAISFTDVAVNAYYYDAVKFAVENGITTGKTDTTFEPATVNTRAEAVTFLWRAAGALAVNPDAAFEALTDVDADSYYTDAVIWAVENGITMGTSDTAFSPDKACTRGEIITFLYRLAGEPEVTGDCDFTDVDADEYYSDAVLWAVQNGITQGMGDGLFAPDQDCSRAEIVTFLYRYLSEVTL